MPQLYICTYVDNRRNQKLQNVLLTKEYVTESYSVCEDNLTLAESTSVVELFMASVAPLGNGSGGGRAMKFFLQEP